jgi:hypothetical protein
MKIYKHGESIKDVKIGDIIEVSLDIFVKVLEFPKSYDEHLGNNKQSTYHLNGVVVDLK